MSVASISEIFKNIHNGSITKKILKYYLTNQHQHQIDLNTAINIINKYPTPEEDIEPEPIFRDPIWFSYFNSRKKCNNRYKPIEQCHKMYMITYTYTGVCSSYSRSNYRLSDMLDTLHEFQIEVANGKFINYLVVDYLEHNSNDNSIKINHPKYGYMKLIIYQIDINYIGYDEPKKIHLGGNFPNTPGDDDYITEDYMVFRYHNKYKCWYVMGDTNWERSNCFVVSILSFSEYISEL